MSQSRDTLQGALTSDNVQAFLRVIRQGESSQEADAYTIMFGGAHFESFADHPRQLHTVGALKSTAAGAYQFLQRTWDALVKQYAFADFTPQSQDEAAVALIAGRKALDDVIAGRIVDALRKCAPEWASLPGATYGQPTQKLTSALAVYAQHGGQLAVSEPPPLAPPPPSQPQEQPVMAPLIIPILSAIASFIPALKDLGFGSGSEVANRNVAAGALVAQKLVEVTQSANLQEAAEKIQSDPAMLETAKTAVQDIVYSLSEIGGGVGEARKAAQESDGDWRKVIFSFPFLLAVALMPLVYAVVVAALIKTPWLAEMSGEMRSFVINSVMMFGLGSVIGYVYGTTMSSAKKDALIASK